MPEDDTPLWTVLTPTGKRVECVMRFAPGGVELEITVDGERVASQVFPSGTEAVARAEDEREHWEGEG